MESPGGYVRVGMQLLPPEERKVAQARMVAWVTSSGVTPYTGDARWCLGRLARPRHRCGRRCYPWYWPNVLDHCEWWKGPQGEWVLTCHPYGVSEEGSRELDEIVRRFGPTVTVDPNGSWYSLYGTTLLVLWGLK